MKTLSLIVSFQEISLKTANDESLYEAVESLTHMDRNSVAKGALEVIRALERGEAKLVIFAQDAAVPGRLDIVKLLCEKKSVPVLSVASKLELGRSAGLDVAASCIALAIAPSIQSS